MKAKRARRLAAALGALLISSAARAVPKLKLEQLQGHWVRKDCLAGLRLSRSPMKSPCGGFSYLFVDEQGWKGGYNFHETGGDRSIQSISADDAMTNLYSLEGSPAEDAHGQQKVRVIRRQEGAPVEIQWLKVGGDAQGPLFVRAEDGEFALQANRIALAGGYVDERGQAYRFTEASQAQWPGQTFAYKVGLDFIEGPDCDYFEVVGQQTPEGFPLRYGFRWDGGKLLIYNMIETRNEDRREAKPLHVLTPR